ncbi:hypothetical protein [Pontibacillus salipaludis]|uniref:Uncharacterized protein n=1 Tax=Pontibacillus salipaludis TaxID=1697394 RepID=A0ABQ1Q4W5_9BACI|nr:hypothetical protein [Pontibacillus salipaludis]GGD14052.1 hypothetical protein GCM10011389_22130 [Pontibacillus salipaludis]
MNERHKNANQKWSKIREKGKKHYILYYGVLGWGLSTGVLFFLLGEGMEHKLTFGDYFTGGWVLELAIAIGSFLLGGLLFGYTIWGLNEGNYMSDEEVTK